VSRSLTRVQAAALGAVVLLAVAGGVYGLFLLLPWLGGDALEVRVGFDNVGGVEKGTRVRLQGMDAGEVAAVEPPAEPGDPVMLRLRLKGDFRRLVRSDARVRIVGEGLVGGKVVEVLPRRRSPGEPPAPLAENGAVLTAQATVEASDIMEQSSAVLQRASALLEGEGTVGKLLHDPKLYNAAVAALEQSKDTFTSLQENSDGLQRTWLMKGVVQKPHALLERFNSQRDRRVFAEADLFAPGQAVLTAQGKAQLDRIAPWLNGMKHPNSDVVVAAYAEPRPNRSAQSARDLTEQQSEAVGTYLRDRHGVHKMGWFSSRKVTLLGLGYSPPPSPEPEPLPPGRVEVMVFVPQK
jgi:phospholipid/cholesterol/gamma-HCH transport system substrate-binding protein